MIFLLLKLFEFLISRELKTPEYGFGIANAGDFNWKSKS